MPDAWRHQRADGTCALLLSRFCAGSRRAAAPLFSPLDIDDILFRDRYALLREEMEVDRFLKWRGDNVRNIFPRIGMLFEPFEMRIIPFPSINMEFRAVAHPTPLLPPCHAVDPVTDQFLRPETTEYFSRSRARHAHCLHRLCSFRRVVVVVILLVAGKGTRRWNERVYRYRPDDE